MCDKQMSATCKGVRGTSGGSGLAGGGGGGGVFGWKMPCSSCSSELKFPGAHPHSDRACSSTCAK